MLDEKALEGLASFLQETKYRDLNNVKKHKSVDDVRKSAHSQGYDISEPKITKGDHYTVDMTHRKSGEKVGPRKGGTIGGSLKTGDKVDTTLVNLVSSTIKGDRAKRGGVDKTPAGKAKRAEQARQNLKAKQAKRGAPFKHKADGTTTKKRSFDESMSMLTQWLTDDSD